MTRRQRLEFEPDLLSQITAAGRRRKRSIQRMWLITFPVVALVGIAPVVAGGGAMSFGFFSSRNNAALTRMATTFLTALKAGNLDEALAVCAEGSEVSAALDGEGTRAYKNAAQRPDETAPRKTKETRLSILAALRDDLVKRGVKWESIHPLACAAVCAQVKDPTTMRDAVQVATGQMYFACGDEVYAIDFSARRPKAEYFIVDLWQWARIDARVDNLKSFARARFDEFSKDPGDAKSSAQLSRIKQIYLEL